MNSAKQQRNKSVEALRGLGCLCVFFHHCQFPNIVYWAITMFFMLSGALLTRSEMNKTAQRSCTELRPVAYACKSIKKLYPLHIVFTLVALALQLYWGRHDTVAFDVSLTAKQLAANVLLIQSWIPDAKYYWSLNNVSWYLSTIAFLYFLFPFVFRIIGRYKSKAPAFLCMAGLLALQYFLAARHEDINRFLVALFNLPEDSTLLNWIYYISPLFRSIDFLIGCNLGYILSQPSQHSSKIAVYSIDVMCVLLFVIAARTYRGSSEHLSILPFQRGPLFTPFCIFFISSFVINRGLISRVLTNRFTLFMGNISAEFYLVHLQIITCMYRILTRVTLAFEYRLFIVCIVSAALSTVFCLVWTKFTSKIKVFQ